MSKNDSIQTAQAVLWLVAFGKQHSQRIFSSSLYTFPSISTAAVKSSTVIKPSLSVSESWKIRPTKKLPDSSGIRWKSARDILPDLPVCLSNLRQCRKIEGTAAHLSKASCTSCPKWVRRVAETAGNTSRNP